MRLLLIFALTFTLSAKGDKKNDADAESTENGNGMMEKVINAIGEKDLTKIMKSLSEHDLDKLTECIESDCKMTDFLDLMKKIISVFKEISQCDKVVYQFIEKGKEIIAEAINAIGEEGREQIMKSLHDDDLDKLTECTECECEKTDFVDLMQKILSVLKGISHGNKLIHQLMKGIFKHGPLAELMNTFGEQRMLGIINALNGKEIEKLMRIFIDGGEEKTDLPYYHPVPCGLHPGMAVYLQGTVPKYPKRFQVQFACGKDRESNVSLYFNPHFDDNRIHLWTYQAQKWENREHYKMPLQKGEHFEILFIVYHIEYQILVNGKTFCRYNHRIPPQRVKEIRFSGDLELQSLALMGGRMMGNMALPYYQPVPGGLRPGMSVYVQGMVPKHLRSSLVNFVVNFACGQHKGAQVPLHFRPYINSNTVVLNTFEVDGWGKEEIHQYPFRKGKHFEIIFIVTEAEYQILVNRKLFYSFRHRIPPESMQIITVDGDLDLQSLTVMRGPMMRNMTLPYHQPVPGGLHPGMSVYVQGMVPQGVNRSSVNFKVDFACGQHAGADVLLHFSPLINAKIVVLNTLESDGWGKEETHQNPFRKGQYFEVLFIVTEAGYQVLVNRNTFCTYGHRLPPQSVQVVSAGGDLELQFVTVMGRPIMGNTTLPYHHPVPGGLLPGMSVYVQGKVPKHPKRSWVNFVMNFACGQHNGAHVPLHFRPHISGNIVVLNTFESGRWGKDERHQNPFQKGEHFEIIFIVTKAEYQILVNGSLFCTYKHRTRPQSVQDISVDGDLELQSLTVMGGPMMRNTMMTNPAFYYPTLPYTCNIPGGLGVHKNITMRGFIPKNATRFEISFMAGQDIALHINPRIKPWTYVARNSLLNNQWGTEERDLSFNPFQPGKYFKLSISCSNHAFQVYTNGRHWFNFIYRYVPIEHIQTIKIIGDVTLSYIEY